MSRQSELAELSRIFDSSALSNRNLIINGSCQVNQRGDSTGISTQGYHGPDRFDLGVNGRDQWVVSISQAADGPDGYSNSFKLQTTTVETSITDTEYVMVRQIIEAQNLQHLAYGTSSAKKLTASFWVKSSITGTFGIFMYQYDGNRTIGSTYTINSANTWEYKTVTFAGDTGGTINDDNGAGQYLAFTIAAGSDLTTTDNTSWGSYSAGKFGFGHSTAANAVMTTLNATWQVTGVQLEVGDSATSFEHRSYGDELLRCKRYYEEISGGSDAFTFSAKGQGSTSADATINLTVPLRASPTLNSVNSRAFGDSGTFDASSSTTPTVSQFDANNPCVVLNCGGFDALTNNKIVNWCPVGNTLEIDAEL